jgi:hypothetical protein
MPNESSAIPLADVLRAANELVAAGLIEDYALGGALAAIYSYLQKRGWRVEREHLVVNDFPVQFLAAAGLTEEAVRQAREIEYEGVPAKVFRPEYIVAIAASVGRHKDLARIEQLLEQAEIDRTLLEDILRRYKLRMPKS